MIAGADYVVTESFYSSNGAGGIVEFRVGDHLFLLGTGHDPDVLRAWLSRGADRIPILFFQRSDVHAFVRLCRHV